MKKIIFIFLLTTMTSLAHADDKTITICSFEWLPHHGETLTNGGYTAELIREIFEPQGYKIEKKFLPWKRAQSYAKKRPAV